ncbi:unnamed protein product [Rotaria sp. Silwood1]|nr:unnamed protein product [Rotaria sp. Silwood1]CAF3891430.1 unnamed protein product [Rotaria sp. Silwood1]CAF3904168.1 unnamed protein product [Rotaria sp. Silwood1]CAF4004769.1 unnamed protein product [Rotaria sp. Silwood1]CAF4951443.1 unnamed protein product [Rotaria sp. Silwood1]
MARALRTTSEDSSKYYEWVWKSNPNPWSESEPAVWSHYSDVENLIIEQAFADEEPTAVFSNYYIDFKSSIQVSKIDHNKKRPVKRVVRKKEDKSRREARFLDLPVSYGPSFAGEYGWISPFVRETKEYLKLKENEEPSKDRKLIPMLVEKAARGIIEESKYFKKKWEGERMANTLREKENQDMREVWKCCAYLYTTDSFLYKTLNATMRFVGDKEHEDVWRSKICTLGPYCLLLWDDPFNRTLTINKTLYRGANLLPEMIAKYEDLKDTGDYGSFQAFTSCSRNRKKAEEFGNCLFILQIEFAFIADVSQLSEYSGEEEELITPGVSFRVHNVELDRNTNQRTIDLKLRQRFSGEYGTFL